MEIQPGEKKKRGARGDHKRLVYSFNVNRTSLDHLLLGGIADVDKSVEWAQYIAGLGRRRRKCASSAKACGVQKTDFGRRPQESQEGTIYRAPTCGVAIDREL